MASLADRNSQTITAAFTRFRQTTDERFRIGMERLLGFAVQAALEHHDDRHQNHSLLGDTYGWVLFHDGVEVSRNIVGHGDGDVTERLGTVPHWDQGWCGIVMAGMNPVGYFDVIYEFVPMRKAIADLKQNGLSSSYFKRI